MAAAHVTFTAEAVQKVREVAEEAVWNDARYSAQGMALTYGDTPAYNKQ